MIISSNLYQDVIEKNAPQFKQLKILSGYASAEFLERVVNQFSHLDITLYIGMAKQGITIKDHTKFKKICKDNNLVKIYYQIYEPNNHMKIYQFENGNQILGYIGSANFSENGFLKQREILTSSNTNLQDIFDQQLMVSLDCMDKNITDYITLTAAENLEKGEDKADVVRQNLNVPYVTGTKSSSNFIKNKSFLRAKIDLAMYEKFDLLIVQSQTHNPHWETSTINARFNNRTPYVRQNNTWIFQNVFPVNKEFEIYFEEKCITAYLGGEFGAHLYFKYFDLYEYLNSELLLDVERPICYEELVENGLSRLYFTRINEDTYLMSFENNS